MIKTFIEDHSEEMICSISELVSIPSVMGDAQEGAPFGKECVRALRKALEIAEDMGFSVRNIDSYAGTAEYIPDGADGIGLAILCHLDVVPAGDGWSFPPFEMTRADGKIIGRGVIDDKGPAMAALYGLYAVKELNIPLKKGVRIVFGTNEENGSEDLGYYLKKETLPENVFTPDGSFPVINVEKGMIRSKFKGSYAADNDDIFISVKGGTVANAVPEKAEAVIKAEYSQAVRTAAESDRSGAKFTFADNADGTVTVTSKGRSAHASTPESGINAVIALLDLLVSASHKETEAVKIIKGLTEIFPFGETDGRSAGLKCADDVSGALTCVFSLFEMKNGAADGTVDVRFPVCTCLENVRKTEEAAFAKAGCKFDGFMGDEPHCVDENSDFIRTLLRVFEKHTGQKGECIAIGGGTYVHNINGGVAFGAELGSTDYHMHGADEFFPVSELIADAAIYGDAISEICG